MIRSFCRNCFGKVEFPDELANQREKCPHCGQTVRVGPHPLPEGRVHPLRIGGWLLLLGIGFVLSASVRLNEISEVSKLLERCPAGKTGVFREVLLLDKLFLGALVVTGVIFFLKWRFTPQTVITLLGLNILVTLVEIGLVPGCGEDIIGPLIAGAIWIPYWLLSKRVKATFTR